MINVSAAKVRIWFPRRFQPGYHCIGIRCVNHYSVAVCLLMSLHNVLYELYGQRSPYAVCPYIVPGYASVFQPWISPAGIYHNIRLIGFKAASNGINVLKINIACYRCLRPVLIPDQGRNSCNIYIGNHFFFPASHNAYFHSVTAGRKKIVQKIGPNASQPHNHNLYFLSRQIVPE